MGKDVPTKQELDDGADARAAAWLHENHQTYQAHLRLARRLRVDMGMNPDLIASALRQANDEFEAIAAKVGGKIVRRAHPGVSSEDVCTVYIDECGQHVLDAKDPFKAFSLAAVIVPASRYEEFDGKWKSWKTEFLGGDKRVHEVDVGRKSRSFWCDGNRDRQDAAIAALPGIIRDLPFSAVCCVLHREKYLAKFGALPLNASLPDHAYLMTLQFLAERIALALQHNHGGAKARLVLEARGPMEDATLQYEFARLFLDGTAYLSATYFRHQFFPGLTFLTKGDNNSGLQLADLLARPCADKVLAPETDPPTWESFRGKLAPGKHTQNSVLGLKVLPWEDCYACMCPG